MSESCSGSPQPFDSSSVERLEHSSLKGRLSPEEHAALASIPDEARDLSDIEAARKVASIRFATLPRDTGDVAVSDYRIESSDGTRIRVRIYRPADINGKIPALMWMHGGGLVMGHIDWDDSQCAHLSREGHCIVVSVDYRLAPEYPYPKPLEDCTAALWWIGHNADDLGADGGRIAVGGASAGAGLAAASALWARDHGGPHLTWQMLIYPMLDHRNVTVSSRRFTHPNIWNRADNVAAWNAYLSGHAGESGISPYASPALATNLSGLPSAYIAVGELDLFLDENIDYAKRLLTDGVATELHVYTGAFHGSDLLAPQSPLSRRWIADRDQALRRALHGKMT